MLEQQSARAHQRQPHREQASASAHLTRRLLKRLLCFLEAFCLLGFLLACVAVGGVECANPLLRSVGQLGERAQRWRGELALEALFLRLKRFVIVEPIKRAFDLLLQVAQALALGVERFPAFQYPTLLLEGGVNLTEAFAVVGELGADALVLFGGLLRLQVRLLVGVQALGERLLLCGELFFALANRFQDRLQIHGERALAQLLLKRGERAVASEQGEFALTHAGGGAVDLARQAPELLPAAEGVAPRKRLLTHLKVELRVASGRVFRVEFGDSHGRVAELQAQFQSPASGVAPVDALARLAGFGGGVRVKGVQQGAQQRAFARLIRARDEVEPRCEAELPALSKAPVALQHKAFEPDSHSLPPRSR